MSRHKFTVMSELPTDPWHGSLKTRIHSICSQQHCNTISDSSSGLRKEHFNGSEYVFSDPHHNYTFVEAVHACAVVNTSLTSVTTNQEQDFLIKHMTR